jgi:hypothetical protein
MFAFAAAQMALGSVSPLLGKSFSSISNERKWCDLLKSNNDIYWII